jgi:hypothetical protein
MNNHKSTQKTREILTVTPKEARDIVFEGGYGPWEKETGNDTPGYQSFKKVSEEMINHSRWAVGYHVILQRENDGKFFSSSYEVGATESQDQSPYEYDDPIFTEVFPVEKTIIVYE